MKKTGLMLQPYFCWGCDIENPGLTDIPAKIKWDLSNGPLSEALEILDTQVRSVGPVGDFLET